MLAMLATRLCSPSLLLLGLLGIARAAPAPDSGRQIIPALLDDVPPGTRVAFTSHTTNGDTSNSIGPAYQVENSFAHLYSDGKPHPPLVSDEDLGPQRPHGQFPPGSGVDLGPQRPQGQVPPGSGLDLGPQRPQGQFPPGSGVDLGPQRPHGQFPPSKDGPLHDSLTQNNPSISNDEEIIEIMRRPPVDLGPHRPAGQTDPNGPPGSNNDSGQDGPQGSTVPKIPLADEAQSYNSYEPIDLGPQRPSGQFPPGSGVDLGPQRPHGQFPPAGENLRLSNSYPPKQNLPAMNDEMEIVDINRSHSQRRPPADVGPHRPAGQTDPNGPPGSNNDLDRLGPEGSSRSDILLADGTQSYNTHETIDLGPQRPHGQFPPGESENLVPRSDSPLKQSVPTLNEEVEVVEMNRPHTQRKPPEDVGPHRPAGQTDPNGPPGSNNDLDQNRSQGSTGAKGLLAEESQFYNHYETIDLGPQRPSGQFPPSGPMQDENSEDFRIYWNVPTFMCHRYGFPFSNLSDRYGVVQNEKDVFRGRKITILYDPGLYPAMIEDDKGNQTPRNGGVPQAGNLALHLQHFEKSIKDQVPQDFDGLGVIDFEAWRPIWAQNWGVLRVYQTYSIELERGKSPQSSNSTLRRRAKQQFEDAAKLYFLESLELAKKIRPKGKWGYYAYPYCFNQSPHNPGYHCSPDLRKQNTQIQWLFDASTALFPSVYLSRGQKTEDDEFAFILGRLQEAQRVAGSRPIVFPYMWYRYQDTRDYVSDEDLRSSLVIPRGLGMAGAVLWGSSGDMNTQGKCSDLQRELEQRLGPAIRRYSRTASSEEIQELLQERIAAHT